MFIYPFEKLQAWHHSTEMVVKIYAVTAKFPAEERYGLVQQIRRAAISVSSNLSEGSGRFSAKDQSHFYSISYSSLLELLNQLLLSKRLGWLTDTEYEDIRPAIETLSAIINALRASILKKELKH